MSNKSAIEWTDATWNPTVGCSIVSPGCTNCYAMRDAWRKHHNPALPQYRGLTKKVNGNPIWTGIVGLAPDRTLLQPLRWREPRRIFVNSMSDLFHESLPDEAIDKVFAVMALCRQHTFQVLTKRAERMRQWFAHVDRADNVGLAMLTLVDRIPHGHRQLPWPLPNVWLGVSTERQQEADERIPFLLGTPAAVRFISAEPLLGPIDLMMLRQGERVFDALQGAHARKDGDDYEHAGACAKLDWVIVGGESGPGARHVHPEWVRKLRDECADSDVPFFFKQWGVYSFETRPGTEVILPDLDHNQAALWGDGKSNHIVATRVGKKKAGRLLDGIEHNEFPIQKQTAERFAA